jgi:uncharacterized membrane protein YvlD (DUF360 family)
MRRFLIFPLLGPLIGLLVTVIALSLYSRTMPGPRAEELRSWLVMAYWAGFVPACLAAVIDWLLSRKVSRAPRAAAMLGIGFVTSFVWGLLIGYLTLNTFYYGVLLGFFGMVPAAVCSWLSAGRRRDK